MEIALAGLGRMGRSIAHRLLDAGHDLWVFNRSAGPAEELAKRGATVVEAPVDLFSSGPRCCITMLADSQALESVVGGPAGVLAASCEGATLIDMSTVSVDSSERVAELAADRGVSYLRAPVSGNPAVVAAGNLTIVVSGPGESFSRHQVMLRDIGPNIFQVGEADEARVVKLALNLMLAGTAQLMAEALTLGEASGIDRATMLAVMGDSAVGSPFVKYKTEPLVADDYSPTFSSALMHKDLTLALAWGRSAGVPLPVTASVDQMLIGCMAQGLAEQDFIALVRRLRREAGMADLNRDQR